MSTTAAASKPTTVDAAARASIGAAARELHLPTVRTEAARLAEIASRQRQSRAATGDGNVKRQLYTDNDLAVIQFRRCIIINGIDMGGLNGDLIDRLALVDLGRITEAQRRDETELEAEWLQAHPDILGGLLDLAAKVHHRVPTIRVDRLPRMADFAKVLACIDEIHHTEGLQRYRERATHLAADSVAADPFIARLQEISYTAEDVTAAEILAEATPTDPGWRRPKDWPKKPRMVSVRLTRHAPTLRALGWTTSGCVYAIM